MTAAPRYRLLVAILLALIEGHGLAAADGATKIPQRDLKAFTVPDKPNAMEMTPQEDLLVIELTDEREAPEPRTHIFGEKVRVWDFRNSRIIAERELRATEVKAKSAKVGDYYLNPISEARLVTLGPDGKLAYVRLESTVYVLSVPSLETVHTIELDVPLDRELRFGDKSYPIKAFIANFQLSPTGDRLALLWQYSGIAERLDVYDTGTGKIVASWDLSKHSPDSNLFWHPKGEYILFSGRKCCFPGSDKRVVLSLELASGAISEFDIDTGGKDVCITNDGRVLLASVHAKGVFAHRRPELEVLDLVSGKRLRKLKGPQEGIRGKVASSADGRRIVAYTGTAELDFNYEWLGFENLPVQQNFTVWDGRDYSPLVTSQHIPGLNGARLWMSSTGRYALILDSSAGNKAPRLIVELP